MPSEQQIMTQQLAPTASRGIFPSELLPPTLPQPPIIDPLQNLQATELREQLGTLANPKPIKHGEQVLFQPAFEEDVHIVLATDALIPKVLVNSLELFLEITLLKISQSAPLDVKMHTYIPADQFFLTLDQLKRGRPHFEIEAAFVESRLAYICILALSHAKTFSTRPFRDHQAQYCRLRLTMALYTSSPIILEPLQGQQEKARLKSWKYIQREDRFDLTLEISEQKTVQKLVAPVSIFKPNAKQEVKLVSIEDEVILLHQISARIRQEKTKDQGKKHTLRPQDAKDYIDPKQAFAYSFSDREPAGQQGAGVSLKRKRVSERGDGKRKIMKVVHSAEVSGYESSEDSVLERTRGDTEPL